MFFPFKLFHHLMDSLSLCNIILQQWILFSTRSFVFFYMSVCVCNLFSRNSFKTSTLFGCNISALSNKKLKKQKKKKCLRFNFLFFLLLKIIFRKTLFHLLLYFLVV